MDRSRNLEGRSDGSLAGGSICTAVSELVHTAALANSFRRHLAP